jgi:hypothetical protein
MYFTIDLIGSWIWQLYDYPMQCTTYCDDLSWHIIVEVLSGLLTEDNMLVKYTCVRLLNRKST